MNPSIKRCPLSRKSFRVFGDAGIQLIQSWRRPEVEQAACFCLTSYCMYIFISCVQYATNNQKINFKQINYLLMSSNDMAYSICKDFRILCELHFVYSCILMRGQREKLVSSNNSSRAKSLHKFMLSFSRHPSKLQILTFNLSNLVRSNERKNN